jgi:hypothetical protein
VAFLLDLTPHIKLILLKEADKAYTHRKAGREAKLCSQGDNTIDKAI